VEIFDLRESSGRAITEHGSLGATAQALVRSEGVAITVLPVAAGGEIGRHPATVDQLFLLVAGRGWVQGAEGTWRDVEAGQAALWRSGGGARHSRRAGHHRAGHRDANARAAVTGKVVAQSAIRARDAALGYHCVVVAAGRGLEW
jgi:hypothetical protein